MDFNFTLLQISFSDWTGISLFAFETEETYLPLLHFEKTESNFQIIVFFIFPITFYG
jgi:hypothetical protein